MGKIIFVRHGESEANLAKHIATADSKLTETGINQAKKTAQELKNFGITRIVCSPMLRAQQTAETIAAELGIDLKHVQVLPELVERRFGKLEGRPKLHESEWYYLSEQPTAEKTSDLFKRMQRCYDKLKELAKNDTVMAVGHGCAGFYLMQVVKGKRSLAEFDSPKQMSNADFVELVQEG